MSNKKEKIALGGSCHWCTEAIFQSLIGVHNVEQGFVATDNLSNDFSEAVIVYFDPEKITLETLIEIHLRTHSSTANHSMRDKYRSAIYTFSEHQKQECEAILTAMQSKFQEKIITQVLPFGKFKMSRDEILNYYYKNPEKPFCQNIIDPKLKILIQQFSNVINKEKLQHLSTNEKNIE